MKTAKVNLISFTPEPILLMCWARRVMHSAVPDSLQEIKENPEKYLEMSIDDYFNEVLLKDGMPTFLEYVNFTFKLENVSRALQQQLTRHRIGFSFSIQSLRCINLPNFADEKSYYNPYDARTLNHISYHKHMKKIQNQYNQALESGIPIQDARGFLPLNIYSTITFSCSLRALIGMINKRLCLKTQEEFRVVAQQMVEQVLSIDKRFAAFFNKPCDKGKCMMMGENEQQFAEGKLTGLQNTDHCCPVFIKKYKEKQ